MRVAVSRRKLGGLYGVAFATAGMLAAACGPVSELEKSSREQAEEVSQELARLLGKGEPKWSSVRVSKRPWLGIEPVQSEDREGLPAELEGADAVTLPLSDIENDEVLASRIEAATKLEIRLLGRSSGETGGVGFVSGLSDGWTPAAGIWTGPLGRLLDAWSAAGGYEWRYLEGRVEVLRRKTVTLGINALAGSQNYSAQTATRDRASGEGAVGSARQTLSTRAEFNPWPEIRGQLEQLVGADGELAVSSGSVAELRGKLPVVKDGDVPKLIEVLKEFSENLNTHVSDFNWAREMEKDGGSWRRWAAVVVAVPVLLGVGLFGQHQFQVVPDGTNGWKTLVWETHGIDVAKCMRQAAQSRNPVNCPLRVRPR